MDVLDGATVARLKALGIDLVSLLRAYGLSGACQCAPSAAWQPAADVYEVADEVIIKVDLAGVAVEEVTLTIAETLVVLRGERRPDVFPREGCDIGRMEIEYGPFEKRIWLPWPVKTKGIRYSYERGFLLIAMPRARRPSSRPASIRVRV